MDNEYHFVNDTSKLKTKMIFWAEWAFKLSTVFHNCFKNMHQTRKLTVFLEVSYFGTNKLIMHKVYQFVVILEIR
jgi:hypothetical protein